MQILKYARTIPCVCLSADTKDNSIGSAILTDSKNKKNVILVESMLSSSSITISV